MIMQLSMQWEEIAFKYFISWGKSVDFEESSAMISSSHNFVMP